MLANRPKGISINKNAINVQSNNGQQKLAGPGGKATFLNDLKRPLQEQPEGPLKRPSSKTPSPPKLKSQLLINLNLKQSENDVPAPLQPAQPSKLQLLKPQQQQQLTTTTANVTNVISRIPRLKDVEEEIEDIDKSSDENRDAILQVCDVAKDIYSYLYELEEIQSIPQDFLKDQKIFTPKIRQRLINWCVNLTGKLELLAETMYMTVSLIDRYFAKVVVRHQSHVQLVALGALLIASKYEEIYPPDVNDLIAYSENAYSRRDIMRMEIDILEKLDFNLGKPIPAAFLRRFSKAAQCDLKMHSIAKFFMEISLTEYECAHWKPSMLAAAALFATIHIVHNQTTRQQEMMTASSAGLVRSTRLSAATNGFGGTLGNGFGLTRRLVSGPPVVQDRWNKTLIHYSRYTRRDLQKPAATLCKILKRDLKGPQMTSAIKHHQCDLPNWPELKSTRVDELIRLGDSPSGLRSIAST